MLFAAVTLLVAASSVANAAQENAAITCRVESPVDGSYWIGTAGDGLFRLGRNGRTLRYSESGGQLGSDSVKALAFDNLNILWILDGSGVFRTYSSVKGFQVKDGLPRGILAAVGGAGFSTLFFATSSAVFSYEPASGSLKELSEISVIPQSMCLSDNGAEVWLFAKDGVLKVSSYGGLLSWDDAPGVLDLLPFKYETNLDPERVEGDNSFSTWVVVLIALFAFLAGWALRNSRRSSSETEALEVLPKAQNYASRSESQKDVPIRDTTNSKSAKSDVFTKRVIGLINENLSDPDFDVESIAALTGLSRIHVNRKLKAEGSASPSSLIKDARMEMALKLLKQGRLSVSQISAQCGFRTPSYFATAFKEYFGYSPSDFVESDSR